MPFYKSEEIYHIVCIYDDRVQYEKLKVLTLKVDTFNYIYYYNSLQFT